MYERICPYCEELFETDSKIRKYCSSLCRSRQGQKDNGKDAKPFKCLKCGNYFKRRSATNTKCKTCRDQLKTGTRKSLDLGKIPKLDRELELSMQEEWLLNNKPTTL